MFIPSSIFPYRSSLIKLYPACGPAGIWTDDDKDKRDSKIESMNLLLVSFSHEILSRIFTMIMPSLKASMPIDIVRLYVTVILSAVGGASASYRTQNIDERACDR